MVAHSKVQGLSAVSCAETAEPIDLPFGLWARVGRRKHFSSSVFTRWHQYAHMGVHISATWRIQLNHPSVVVMRSYVKLL